MAAGIPDPTGLTIPFGMSVDPTGFDQGSSLLDKLTKKLSGLTGFDISIDPAKFIAGIKACYEEAKKLQKFVNEMNLSVSGRIDLGVSGKEQVAMEQNLDTNVPSLAAQAGITPQMLLGTMEKWRRQAGRTEFLGEKNFAEMVTGGEYFGIDADTLASMVVGGLPADKIFSIFSSTVQKRMEKALELTDPAEQQRAFAEIISKGEFLGLPTEYLNYMAKRLQSIKGSGDTYRDLYGELVRPVLGSYSEAGYFFNTDQMAKSAEEIYKALGNDASTFAATIHKNVLRPVGLGIAGIARTIASVFGLDPGRKMYGISNDKSAEDMFHLIIGSALNDEINSFPEFSDERRAAIKRMNAIETLSRNGRRNTKKDVEWTADAGAYGIDKSTGMAQFAGSTNYANMYALRMFSGNGTWQDLANAVISGAFATAGNTNVDTVNDIFGGLAFLFNSIGNETARQTDVKSLRTELAKSFLYGATDSALDDYNVANLYTSAEKYGVSNATLDEAFTTLNKMYSPYFRAFPGVKSSALKEQKDGTITLRIQFEDKKVTETTFVPGRNMELSLNASGLRIK